MDTSYAKSDSYDTPDSNPWGAGGVPDKPVTVYGRSADTMAGFYEQRDDMVGGTDTRWNLQAEDVPQQSGAKWASYGDSAEVVTSASGLDGERCKFSGAMSQEALAGGSNPDSPYGH